MPKYGGGGYTGSRGSKALSGAKRSLANDAAFKNHVVLLQAVKTKILKYLHSAAESDGAKGLFATQIYHKMRYFVDRHTVRYTVIHEALKDLKEHKMIMETFIKSRAKYSIYSPNDEYSVIKEDNTDIFESVLDAKASVRVFAINAGVSLDGEELNNLALIAYAEKDGLSKVKLKLDVMKKRNKPESGAPVGQSHIAPEEIIKKEVIKEEISEVKFSPVKPYVPKSKPPSGAWDSFTAKATKEEKEEDEDINYLKDM